MVIDKNDKKRQALTQKLLKLDDLEDDYLSLKRHHEDRVSNLHSEFHNLSSEIETLLYDTPEFNLDRRRQLMENDDINQQVDGYVNHHLEDLSQKTRILRSQWDDERESLIKERNHLPWE